MFSVAKHRLKRDDKFISYVAANSYGSRMSPTGICWHDTADRPSRFTDTVNYFKSNGTRVSAHLVMGRKGLSDVVQMVPFDHKAYHAGQSRFHGVPSCNNFLIGVEIDNPGKLDKNGRAWFHKNKYGKPIAPGLPLEDLVEKTTKEHGTGLWLPYTEVQIEAVIEVGRALVKAYPRIRPDRLTSHYIISPRRKIDCNPLFPLDYINDQVFAVGPKKRRSQVMSLKMGSTGDDVLTAQKRLRELHYVVGTPDKDFGNIMRDAVLSFEAENDLKLDGELGRKEFDLLLSDKAKARPLNSRENITVKDLKKNGSETLWFTGWGKRLFGWLFVGATGTGVDQVSNEGVGMDTVISGLEKTKSMTGQIGDLVAWLWSSSGVIIIGLLILAGVGYVFLDRIEKKRVKKARQGQDFSDQGYRDGST